MNHKEATRYMYWFGEKIEAGDTPTEEEWKKLKEARVTGLKLVKLFLRLEPKDWKYTPGEPFS